MALAQHLINPMQDCAPARAAQKERYAGYTLLCGQLFINGLGPKHILDDMGRRSKRLVLGTFHRNRTQRLTNFDHGGPRLLHLVQPVIHSRIKDIEMVNVAFSLD